MESEKSMASYRLLRQSYQKYVEIIIDLYIYNNATKSEGKKSEKAVDGKWKKFECTASCKLLRQSYQKWVEIINVMCG